MRCQSLLSGFHCNFWVYSFCITELRIYFHIHLFFDLACFQNCFKNIPVTCFDWLVLTGKQFSRPCRCLNIAQKLEVSAYLLQGRRVRSTILNFLCHTCVNDIQTFEVQKPFRWQTANLSDSLH